MNYILTASASFTDIGHLQKEVKELETAGIDSFHVDIMDGRFVPNFAMSLNDMRAFAKFATKPIDVHLMIEHPCEQIDLFLNNLREGDTVYIHPEAEYHPSTTLQKIIDKKMIPGIAINPFTSVETVLEMLRIVDKVLVMVSNPGEDGHVEQEGVFRKITKLISLKEEMNFEIIMDGGCSMERIMEIGPKGVDGFVLDDMTLFNKKRSYKETIDLIKSNNYTSGTVETFKGKSNEKVS